MEAVIYIYLVQRHTLPYVAVTAKPTITNVCLKEPSAKCLDLPSNTQANVQVKFNI